MKSIRSYLLSRLLGGVALVLAGAGAVEYVVLTRSAEAHFDRNLADRVQGFASILFQVENTVEFEFSDELMPEYEPGELPAYFQLWFTDGRVVERSNSLAGGDLLVRGTPGETPAHWTAPLPDGRPGRFVARIIEVHHVYPEEGPDRPEAAKVVVAIARGREDLVSAERTVLFNVIAVSLALLTLIAFLSWRAVRRALEPTQRLAATLDAIRMDQLPERLDAGDMPSELEPVAQTTDALIRRVDAAFKRERRTTADIAHELRTPISELITASEVALRDSRDNEGARRTLARVRDVAWRMGRSVATLLKLARLEMGAEKFDEGEADIGEIVQEQLRSLAATERERGLRVENSVAVGDLIAGDRDVLRIVVSNLLSNAMYYSPSDAVVGCRLERAAEGWRLCVRNDAVDLSVEDLGALAEPFWRKDRARADRNHSGLGLSLSRMLAERTGMQLSFEIDAGQFQAILSNRTNGNGLGPSASSGQRSDAGSSADAAG